MFKAKKIPQNTNKYFNVKDRFILHSTWYTLGVPGHYLPIITFFIPPFSHYFYLGVSLFLWPVQYLYTTSYQMVTRTSSSTLTHSFESLSLNLYDVLCREVSNFWLKRTENEIHCPNQKLNTTGIILLKFFLGCLLSPHYLTEKTKLHHRRVIHSRLKPLINTKFSGKIKFVIIVKKIRFILIMF